MHYWYLLVITNIECMPPPSPNGFGLAALAYVAPIAPPVGVAVVAPIGLAPGTNWRWAYHPYNGWKHR